MDCQEITQAAIALRIFKEPESRAYQALFHCIYKLFHSSFINWILKKYGHGFLKENVLEDAKDAFQMGLVKMLEKSQKNELIINASLKTTVYSYGFLQLLAKIKNQSSQEKRKSAYFKWIDLFIEDDFVVKESEELLDERQKFLLEALKDLPEKQRQILVMKFFGKLRSKEIAEKLGVSPGNIDNEKTKAYKALRGILKAKFDA